MLSLRDYSPRRYYVDKNGHHVLVGLTIDETLEFETLDNLPLLGDSGNRVAWTANGVPSTNREERWLDLYVKHDEAWKDWTASAHANPS